MTYKALLHENPMCESCCSMPMGTIVVDDGNTFWCLSCCDAGAVKVPKKVLKRLYELQGQFEKEVEALFKSQKERFDKQ